MVAGELESIDASVRDLRSAVGELFRSPSSVAHLLIRAPDLTILAANTQACAMYGCSADQLVGRSVLELSCQPQETQSLIRQAIDDPSSIARRRMHRRHNGEPFPVDIGFTVFREGDSIYVCKHLQDASQIAATERLLRESHDRFRAVADYTYDWESWIDQQGDLVWVNGAVERLTGFSVERCMQMKRYPLPMIAEEDRARLDELLQGALSGSSGNDVEFRVAASDGSLRWFAVSWQALRDGHGDQIGVRMSMRDIGDRKRMEDRLRVHSQELEALAELRSRRIVELEQRRSRIEKLAALGEMAAQVAHEINNPIAGIKNAIRLVADEGNLPAASSSLLELVDREIGRIAGLLQQLNQLCRPQIPTPEPTDLVRLWREVIELSTHGAERKRIRFAAVDWPTDLYPSLASGELRQIAINLLRNALEASPPEETIEIEIRREDLSWVRMEVRDRGGGISSDIQERIFEPFFTTKHEQGKSGMGLGLAITRSLVQAMGGTISASTRAGGGTCFGVLLPMDPATSFPWEEERP